VSEEQAAGGQLGMNLLAFALGAPWLRPRAATFRHSCGMSSVCRSGDSFLVADDTIEQACRQES